MAQVLYDADETATLRADIERPPLGTDVALENASACRRRALQGSARDRTVTR